MDKEQALEYIIDNADQEWIFDFLYNVVEVDWIVLLRDFPEATLIKWAKELGYINPKIDY